MVFGVAVNVLERCVQDPRCDNLQVFVAAGVRQHISQRLETFRDTSMVSFHTWLNVCQEDVNPRRSSTTGRSWNSRLWDHQHSQSPIRLILVWSLTVIVTDNLSNSWTIHQSRVSFDGEQTLYCTRKRYRVFWTAECLDWINPCYGSWTELIILRYTCVILYDKCTISDERWIIATWWFELHHHHSSTTERTNCFIMHTAAQFACRLLQLPTIRWPMSKACCPNRSTDNRWIIFLLQWVRYFVD